MSKMSKTFGQQFKNAIREANKKPLIVSKSFYSFLCNLTIDEEKNETDSGLKHLS
jgi:hypothetical protein